MTVKRWVRTTRRILVAGTLGVAVAVGLCGCRGFGCRAPTQYHGVVRDAKTGEPIADAWDHGRYRRYTGISPGFDSFYGIFSWSVRTITTRTDASGRFAVEIPCLPSQIQVISRRHKSAWFDLDTGGRRTAPWPPEKEIVIELES